MLRALDQGRDVLGLEPEVEERDHGAETVERERHQAVVVEIGEHGREPRAGLARRAPRARPRSTLDLVHQLGVGEAAVAAIVDQRELARRAVRRHRHQVPGALHHGLGL